MAKPRIDDIVKGKGPELGYGSAGAPPQIPPDATLVFEIELPAVY